MVDGILGKNEAVGSIPTWGTSLLVSHAISAVSMVAESEKVVEIVTDIDRPGRDGFLDHTTK